MLQNCVCFAHTGILRNQSTRLPSAKDLQTRTIAVTSAHSVQATMCVCKQLKDPANPERYTNEPSLRMPVAC